MTLIYRCNQCNQETQQPFTLLIRNGQNETLVKMHACGPDDTIRLAAPLIRDENVLSIMIITQSEEDLDAYS